MKFVKSFAITVLLIAAIVVVMALLMVLYDWVADLISLRYAVAIGTVLCGWYIIHHEMYDKNEGDSVGSEKNAVRQDNEAAGG